MKSEIINGGAERETKYPCLKALNKSSGIVVVFFVKKNLGIVVLNTTAALVPQVGYFSEMWDERLFEPFKGTISLSND